MNPPGIDNFAQVCSILYRGARPSREGLVYLAGIGVRSVIDLEAWFDFNPLEWYFARKLDLAYKSIPCSPWHPEAEDVEAFLSFLSQPANLPAFVHCRQGADRTGMMVAIFRVVYGGWTKAMAISEMVSGGFGFHGAIYPEIVPFVEAYAA